MKKIFITILAITLLYGSCKEVEQLTHFKMDLTNNISILSIPIANIPIDIITPKSPANLQSLSGENNTSIDLIDEIVLTYINLIIKSPNNQTFDFLKDIEININAEGLDEKKIAWYYDIPQTGLKTIDLETTEDGLQEYLKQEFYTLRIHILPQQTITDTTEIEINSSFFVDARLLGI